MLVIIYNAKFHVVELSLFTS